ncbi:MAG: zinc ribbon domain-containing protein [Candidatus Dormibacteraceae bacterium]
MALTCARCGAQNPDGNQFCQACGTPLTAVAAGFAAPPGPPPPPPPPGANPAAPPGPPSAALAYPSPPPTSTTYQSPYYVPAPGAVQQPVHRAPLTLIISAVVALVLVMAGIGTAIAIIGNHSNQTGAGLAAALSSPSPAGSPSPVGSPVTIQGPTASNTSATVPVPTGWSVASKDSGAITLVDPDDTGALTVAGGLSNPSASAQQNKGAIDAYFKGKYPDTADCPNTKTTTGALSGASGIFWTLCFTLTSAAQSIPAAASLFAGASADGGIYYVVQLVTRQDNLQTFVTESKPILAGIQWKLT